MSTPRIICGPILRKVTKNKVSVWIACSRNYNLTLKLYEGDKIKVTADTVEVSSTDTPNLVVKAKTGVGPTIRFGKNLWVAVITAELQVSLQPGKTYSYNIHLKDMDDPIGIGFDLRTDGLLQDDKHEGRSQKAIGYEKDHLPTFVLPADTPENLFISHASCRKMHGHGLDALANLDGIIKKAAIDNVNPFERPQQLFLTGDQIYADDIPGALLYNIGVIDGETLVGSENVIVGPDSNGITKDVDASILTFPPFSRMESVKKYAGFTGSSSHNHLISFEDYAGTYLNYWSVRSWNLDFFTEISKIVTEMGKTAGKEKTVAKAVAKRLLHTKDFPEQSGILRNIWFFLKENDSTLIEAIKFKVHKEDDEVEIAKIFEKPNTGESFEAWMIRISDNGYLLKDKYDNWKKHYERKIEKEVKEIANFLKALPLVSRVLANVPTYMIFDDHEITDDWNLNQHWKNQVMSKPLGRDIVRNGLMAYTVFQDWGNQPEEYVIPGKFGEDTSTLTQKTKLLRLISDYGHAIGTGFGLGTIRNKVIIPIENFLGMGTPPDKAIDWHFEVETGFTKTYVLDTRLNREYPSLNSPPGLITEDSLIKQIPEIVPFGNAPFTFVVSPAPVLGVQGMEEVVQPIVAGLSGSADADLEAWGFNYPAIEHLIERLSKLGKVIILSGDVHYGFTSVLDFWKENQANPTARIVQLTASSLKNSSAGTLHLYQSAIVQKLLTGVGDQMEKLVWKNKVLSVTGQVSAKNRYRLRQSPAVVSTTAWQAGATVNSNPDYRYRVSFQTDNSDRNDIFNKADINLDNEASLREGYKKVVQRHMDNFISGVHRRMVWASNIGLVKIDKEGNDWRLTHEFLYNKGSRNDSKAIGPHMKHSMLLTASTEESNRPELP